MPSVCCAPVDSARRYRWPSERRSTPAPAFQGMACLRLFCCSWDERGTQNRSPPPRCNYILAAPRPATALRMWLLERHDRANVLYRRATELSPEVSGYWYNLACSERSLGRLAEAEEACDRCIAVAPSGYPTYLVRSELRVQSPTANHIEELQARLGGVGSDAGAQAYLGYALAKELDDISAASMTPFAGLQSRQKLAGRRSSTTSQRPTTSTSAPSDVRCPMPRYCWSAARRWTVASPCFEPSSARRILSATTSMNWPDTTLPIRRCAATAFPLPTMPDSFGFEPPLHFDTDGTRLSDQVARTSGIGELCGFR